MPFQQLTDKVDVHGRSGRPVKRTGYASADVVAHAETSQRVDDRP